MHDILPQDQGYYQRVMEVAAKVFGFYDFEKIDTPVLEDAELFMRSIGSGTDIVEKEMFTLRTKGKDFLALRPENTAGVMRAYLQHGLNTLPQPVRMWYYGPCFRHEKPQAGRFRQFYQLGSEVIGETDPIVDAQAILTMYNILQDLGLKNLIVRVNSIGDDNCRPAYRKALVKFLREKKSSLCSDCVRRAKDNPLRVLDCKNEKCQEVLSQAPQSIDFLCSECKQHFKDVLEYLEELKIPYILDSKLVRGLDYYTKTVFEIESTRQGENMQGSLAGGGRYDNLAHMLGGGDIPACGAAAGVERIVAEMREVMAKVSFPPVPDIFFTQIGPLAKKKSLPILEDLRRANIKVGEAFSKDSLKAQLGKASRLGAKVVLILGQREAINNMILVRNMETAKQVEVKQEDIIKEIKNVLRDK
jgi:histidyl-tRNA synthetase